MRRSRFLYVMLLGIALLGIALCPTPTSGQETLPDPKAVGGREDASFESDGIPSPTHEPIGRARREVESRARP